MGLLLTWLIQWLLSARIWHRAQYCLIVGLLWSLWRMMPAEDDVSRQVLREQGASCSLRLRVCDVEALDPRLLNKPKEHLQAQALQIRLNGEADGAWRRACGAVRVSWPLKAQLGPLPPYGATIEAEGALVNNTAALAPDDPWRQRLALNNGLWSFQITSIKAITPATGWRDRVLCGLLEWRDIFLERSTRTLLRPGDPGTLAGIFFGCKQALVQEEMDDYLRAGVMHLFAVSGMHMAIFAGLLLLLLRSLGLGWRSRHLLPPLLLLPYLFMTGCPASAARAWLMITVFCISRAWHEPPLSLHSCSIAAIILMLVSPLEILRPGFQFSFLLILTLIALAPWLHRFQVAWHERELWLPAGRPWHGSLSRMVWTSTFTALAAACACLGVSMITSGITSFIGIGVNILFALAMTPVTLLMMSEGACPGITCGLLEYSLLLIRQLSILAGAQSGGLLLGAAPAGVLVLLQLGAWFTLLAPAMSKGLRAGALTLWLICLVTLASPAHRQGIWLICGPEARVPALLAIGEETVLVNCPDTACARAAEELLRQAGRRHLDVVIATDDNAEHLYGLKNLSQRVDVRRLLLLRCRPQGRASPTAMELLRSLEPGTALTRSDQTQGEWHGLLRWQAPANTLVGAQRRRFTQLTLDARHGLSSVTLDLVEESIMTLQIADEQGRRHSQTLWPASQLRIIPIHP